METSICSPISLLQTRNPNLDLLHANTNFNIVCRNPNANLRSKIKKSKNMIGNCRFPTRILAVNELAYAAGEPAAQAEITWQIVVGALAGVTPFVVAGIEFSKRIVAQRKCGVCGGSGLVLREDYYFRCPGCGGFLPWQSWKRFFSG